MLIAFGNYTQFMKNNKGKTAVEGKNSVHLLEIMQIRMFKIMKSWRK